MSSRFGAKAFTLIEMTLVILIITLFAALIAPNIINEKTAEAKRESFGRVQDMFRLARVRAIQQDRTFAIAYDSGKSEFRLVREPEPQTNNTGSNVASPTPRPLSQVQSVGDYEQIETFDLPSGITATEFRSGLNDTDSGSWLLHFYPDGTADTGGVTLNQGQTPNAIQVDQYGMSTFMQGQNLQDPTQLNWPAGTYVSETQTSS